MPLQDLAHLAAVSPDHGGCLLLELSFPDDYPTNPFQLRLITPRYSAGGLRVVSTCAQGCMGTDTQMGNGHTGCMGTDTHMGTQG